jgi:hypothetical protein
MSRGGWPQRWRGGRCVSGVVPGRRSPTGERFVGAALVESHSAILRRLTLAGSLLTWRPRRREG